MVLGLTDTHAHLYLRQFKNDIDEVIERAKKAGVNKIFLPNIDSSTIADLHQLCRNYSDICKPMMALHPTSVKENYREELKIIGDHIHNEEYVAIGETGIDLYWDKTFLSEQKEAFIMHIAWAREKSLPLVIHARNSFNEIFEILDQEDTSTIKGVFHSFTGDPSHVTKINEYDFYFGINGIVTFKNSGLADTVKAIPPDRLLIETDSPFLSPVPMRGKRNESAYVSYIADKLAEIYELSRDEVAELTGNNAARLFQHAF